MERCPNCGKTELVEYDTGPSHDKERRTRCLDCGRIWRDAGPDSPAAPARTPDVMPGASSEA